MTSEAYERVAAHIAKHEDKIQAAFSILGMKALLLEIDRLKDGAPKSTTKPIAYLYQHPNHPKDFGDQPLTVGDIEYGYTETPLYTYHVTQHPTNGLWQTFDQVHAERDLLLMSVRALQYKVERVNRVSKSRLTRLRKARQSIAQARDALERKAEAIERIGGLSSLIEAIEENHKG